MLGTDRPGPPGSSRLVRGPWRQTLIIAALFVVAAILLLALGDYPIARLAAEVRNLPPVRFIWHLADYLAGGLGPVVFGLAMIGFGYRHYRRLIPALLVGAGLQTGITHAIKYLSGRPRPYECGNFTVFHGPGSDFASMPSGHTAIAALLAVIAAAYFPAWRWLAYLLVAIVAVGRVLQHCHFPSDVLVGAAIGYLAAKIVLSWWPPPGLAARRSEQAEKAEAVEAS